MSNDLKEYYLTGGQLEEKLPPPPPPIYPPLKEADPAHVTIHAGKERDGLMQNYAALESLRCPCGGKERCGDTLGPAMAEVMSRFGSEPTELKITITMPLRDSSGVKPKMYGMKLIHSEKDWADLVSDTELARKYFPDIELLTVPTVDGRNLAVVSGVTAKEFNAVIAAERLKDRLYSDVNQRDKEVEKGRKDMGVDRMPRVPSAADKKPAQQTPRSRGGRVEKNPHKGQVAVVLKVHISPFGLDEIRVKMKY